MQQRPARKLNEDIHRILVPFFDQSVQFSLIIALGLHWELVDDTNQCQSSTVGSRCDAHFVHLEPNGDVSRLNVESVPDPMKVDPQEVHKELTFEGLLSMATELPERAHGEALIILQDRMLEQMMIPPDEDFGFRGIVTISATEGTPATAPAPWKLQRALFDRGLINVGSMRVKEGEAHCFLSSDTVTSIGRVGRGSRGHIAMSNLGTNGRFANQLFQHAFVKLYGLRHDLKAVLPDGDVSKFFNLADSGCSDLSLPVMRFGAFDDDDRILWELEDPPINIDLSGYFQELPTCWRRQRPLLRQLFQLSPDLRRAADQWYHDVTRGGQRTLVAVHVRRRDYVTLSERNLPWFRPVPVQWYLAWLEAIWPTLRDPVLFVATDEPDNIVPHFQEFHPIPAMSGEAAAMLPDYLRDFECLRRADVLAICNSSFSRMAAILAASNQTCFCPSFQTKSFAPYEPWSDQGFWARFSDGAPTESRMGSSETAKLLRGIDARLALGIAHREIDVLQAKLAQSSVITKGLRGIVTWCKANPTSAMSRSVRWLARIIRRAF